MSDWERWLVARVAAGDDSALACAFDQYGSLVFGIAARLLGRDRAADATQDAFCALWQRPDRFDPDRGSLRVHLATVARRRCIDEIRRHGRRVVDEEQPDRAATDAVPNIDEATHATIRGERVRAVLDLLPGDQRRAIEFAYSAGLTFREVAISPVATEGPTKSRIRVGLRALADELRDESPDRADAAEVTPGAEALGFDERWLDGVIAALAERNAAPPPAGIRAALLARIAAAPRPTAAD